MTRAAEEILFTRSQTAPTPTLEGPTLPLAKQKQARGTHDAQIHRAATVTAGNSCPRRSSVASCSHAPNRAWNLAGNVAMCLRQSRAPGTPGMIVHTGTRSPALPCLTEPSPCRSLATSSRAASKSTAAQTSNRPCTDDSGAVGTCCVTCRARQWAWLQPSVWRAQDMRLRSLATEWRA